MLLGDAVVPVCDMWVGTEPHCDAGKLSQLHRDARLSTSQQFPFVRLDGDFKQHCKCPINPSASCSFTLQHWELWVLGLPVIPLYPARRKPWLCWKLLKFVWTKDVCVTVLLICMCSQVKTGGLKLHGIAQPYPKSASAHFWIFWKALLLTFIDMHLHVSWTPLKRCGPMWWHSNLHHQNFRRFPMRMKTGSSGLFLISACKENTSPPRDKAVGVFLLCMAHFQSNSTDQRQEFHTVELPPNWTLEQWTLLFMSMATLCLWLRMVFITLE